MPSLKKKNITLLIIFAVIFLLDFAWINKANKTYAKKYLNESIALSAGTYATCRIINGGVSSLQESSISISPWGIGLQYEAGQILDPINDATERLSDACVNSMALLGVQRLLLFAVNEYTIIPFYVLLAGCLISMSLLKSHKVSVLLGRGAILLLFLRLSTPILCGIGTHINENYFVPKINQQQKSLSKVKEIAMVEFNAEIPQVTITHKKVDSTYEAITQFFTDFKNKIIEYSAMIKHRASSLGDIFKSCG